MLDLLALAAHPDDVELSCGGTVCLLVRQGHTAGIIDFTRGELGTRGTPEIRQEEAEEAGRIIGLSVRENLGLPDGNIANTRENQLAVIRCIRQYRPQVVLINAPECRHPDHGDAARLALSALFYSGLRKIETFDGNGAVQEPCRPAHVLHYMQAIPFEPTFVVDVTETWDQRTQAMLAFRSQFFNTGYAATDDEQETFISNPDFLQWVEARARTLGYRIGATYGEGLLYHQGPIGIDNLMTVLSRSPRHK